MNTYPPIIWVLRLSCAACFIGHGAFGFITKESWIPFFTLFGIPRSLGYQLMPLVGGVDIAVGILVLIFPIRLAVLYMALWATWTALLRPFVGMGWWEFFERAGNYGAPIALLFMMPVVPTVGNWLKPERHFSLHADNIHRVLAVLQISAALLLLGHGGFGFIQKSGLLVSHWQLLGLIPSGWDPKHFIQCVGAFEMLLGLMVLFGRSWQIAGFATVWKIVTELLYPLSGDYWWEFIERTGSYGVLLALTLVLRNEKLSSWSQLWLPQIFKLAGHALSPVASRLLSGMVMLATLLAFVAGNVGIFNPTHPIIAYHVRPDAIALLHGQALLDRLKQGGLVLYFRHFHTGAVVHDDLKQWQHGTLTLADFEDCSWQRPLVPYGRERAALTQTALSKLGIKIGEVYASPYCRCVDSAALISGKEPQVVLGAIYERKEHTTERMQYHVDQLLKIKPSSPDANNIIVAHRTPMDPIGHIAEGDAFVFEPTQTNTYKLIGKIEVNEWIEALGAPQLLGKRHASGYNPPHR